MLLLVWAINLRLEMVEGRLASIGKKLLPKLWLVISVQLTRSFPEPTQPVLT